MKENQKKQITKALNKWLSDPAYSNRSVCKLAKKIDVSSSYVSNIKNGNYVVNGTTIKGMYFNIIAHTIGYATYDDLHWDTDNFKVIQDACSSCQKEQKWRMIDSGGS